MPSKIQPLPLRTLIVDSSATTRNQLIKAAEPFGPVLSAEMAEGARQLAVDAAFDMVILNCHSNQELGFEIARAILEKDPLLPVILILPQLTRELALHCANLRVFGLLENPFESSHLMELLEKSAEYRKKTRELRYFTSLGELTHRAFHEIQGPLSRILLHTEQLQDPLIKGQLPLPRALEHVQAIEATTNKVFRIMSCLRELLEDDNEGLDESVPVLKLFEDTRLLHQDSLAGSGITLQFHVSDPNLRVRGTHLHWMRIMSNLVSNATDAVSRLDSKWIRISAEVAEDGNTRITVSDSGTGIPERVRHRVFEPFFTTRRQGTRSGLGLSIVRKLVRTYDGSIHIDAASPNTSFVIQLPPSG